MAFTIDASWAAGLLFAMSRMAGFTIASPVFGKAIPPIGRFVLVLAMSMWLVGIAPPITSGELGLGDLLGSAFGNVAIGVLLALVSGMIFYLFEVAGGLIDMMSGLQLASVFDPTMGHQVGVFARLFHMTALSIFFVLGGDRIMIGGLARSLDVVPLTGGFEISGGMGTAMVEMLGTLLMAGIEVAAPVLVALFLAEVVLGIASRFSPQTNVFILGMPMKLLIALAVTGGLFALFPGTVDATIARMLSAFSDAAGFLAP
jgi:flagellar biosynthetic protein FliR